DPLELVGHTCAKVLDAQRLIAPQGTAEVLLADVVRSEMERVAAHAGSSPPPLSRPTVSSPALPVVRAPTRTAPKLITFPLAPPVQRIGERHRIKRMDQREAPGHVLRLVALQMPDQVPRHPPARERWSLELLQRLLHPVLSQVGDARSQCGFHRIHSEALGD